MFKSNPVVAQILALALITGFSAQALAAPAAAPAAPAKATPAAPAAAAPVAVLSPLVPLQQDYDKTAKIIEDNLKVFLKHGESCGMIGTKIVEGMKEQKALANQERSHKEVVAAFATAATEADAKKLAAAKKRIEKEIGTILEVYKQIDDNMDAIKMGLDTPEVKTCVTAGKSFYLVRGTADKMLSSLEKANKLLGAKPKKKQANLLTDGLPAYGSHEAAYDTAAAQVEFERAQAEERVETSELTF
ncbi:MAG: hypothetical protein AB7K68_00800 [Bacteriovoracia bacterium]